MAFEALLQERLHALTEFRKVGKIAFAAEQVAAQLLLELLYRTRQGRLRHVAFLGRPREVQYTRNS